MIDVLWALLVFGLALVFFTVIARIFGAKVKTFMEVLLKGAKKEFTSVEGFFSLLIIALILFGGLILLLEQSATAMFQELFDLEKPEESFSAKFVYSATVLVALVNMILIGFLEFHRTGRD